MSVFIKHNKTVTAGLSSNCWVVLNTIESNIKGKIEAAGIPLKNWDIQINYGIKTGFNEAFIIDGKTREELLKKCPEADSIIRPILLGKNIKRYQYNWEGLWLINTHNGIKGKVDPINVEKDYPVVFDYLSQFLPKVELRADQGDHWSNLRNCAYLDAFDKPKIAWGNLALKGQFAFIKEPMMINAPSPFLVTENTYLLALLNSSLADFYIRQLGVSRNGGYLEYKPMFVEQIPIPVIPKELQKPFIEMVDKLIKDDCQDKAAIEIELDNMVFDLFDLTMDERQLIYRAALDTNSISTADKE